jgi:hypothetical protein
VDSSQRQADEEGADGGPLADKSAEKVTDVKMMHLINHFEDLDPTHYRKVICGLKISHKKMAIYAEIEIVPPPRSQLQPSPSATAPRLRPPAFGSPRVTWQHFYEILAIGQSYDPAQHYDFFRGRLKGTVPESELDSLLEEKLIFLVDATVCRRRPNTTFLFLVPGPFLPWPLVSCAHHPWSPITITGQGVPVLLSLLVLIFTAGGEDLTKLPSNRIELYDSVHAPSRARHRSNLLTPHPLPNTAVGIESAVKKRLLPGNRTSYDLLIHDWLRLFNLDRSAMVACR